MTTIVYRNKPTGDFVGYDEYGDISATSNEVIEEERPNTWTGLYNHEGYEIHHYEERVKFGFQGKIKE